jgi:urea transport system permease protein
LFDLIVLKPVPDRQGDYGPDKGAWRKEEGEP